MNILRLLNITLNDFSTSYFSNFPSVHSDQPTISMSSKLFISFRGKKVQNYLNYKASLPNCATGSFFNEGMGVWS